MKKALLKLTAITFFVTAIVAAPALLRADDAATATPAAKGKGGEKFYGPVTAVDTNAMTFVVNDQTYAVTSKTEMTLAKDDSKATLADAVVGQPARGTFTKSSDGKNEVTKVRFGKKSGGAGGKGGKKKKSTSETATNTPATNP